MFFRSEEECKKHEKNCNAAYALRVSISVNMNDSFDTVEKIDEFVNKITKLELPLFLV